jgi:hypothetical protein
MLDGPAVDQRAISLLSKTLCIESLINDLHVPSREIVIHLRFGDDSLVKNSKIMQSLMSSVLMKLANFSKNAMIVSDSEEFKRRVKAMGFETSKSSPIHFGVAKKLEDFQDIFQDFLIIARADTIYWYSVYAHLSGFVQWASILGKGKLIPLILSDTAKVSDKHKLLLHRSIDSVKQDNTKPK